MKILIVIPAHNEEAILSDSVKQLSSYCQSFLSDYDYHILIVNNGSTDQSDSVGIALARDYDRVDYIFLPQAGKGLAIRTGWENQEADVYFFMDADLSTDLSSLSEAIQYFLAGYDCVVGSRFHQRSKVSRSILRRFISICYRWLFKLVLKTRLNDLACGFKAINLKMRNELLGQVADQGWFFDSELMVLAEKQGYRIKELPIIWSDKRNNGRKSRLNIFKTGWQYFKKILALRNKI